MFEYLFFFYVLMDDTRRTPDVLKWQWPFEMWPLMCSEAFSMICASYLFFEGVRDAVLNLTEISSRQRF